MPALCPPVPAAMLLIVALGACGRLPAAHGAAPGAGLSAAMERLERARFAAMVAGDTAALRGYLAPDLVYTHSSGASETRDQFLQHVGSGQLRYGAIEPSELVVRVLGAAALVNGRARLTVGGDSFVVRFLDVWARRDGRWELVAWQSTRAN